MISETFNRFCKDIERVMSVEKSGVAAYREHFERGAILDLARKLRKICDHYEGLAPHYPPTGTGRSVKTTKEAEIYGKELVETSKREHGNEI